MLIILDGYDKAVADQCQQLDEILSSNGSNMKLNYDLIITTKPSKIISRKAKITFVDIVRQESSFISTFGKMAINRLIQLNPKDVSGFVYICLVSIVLLTFLVKDESSNDRRCGSTAES